MEPVDDTEPTRCRELSIGGVMEDCRYGLSRVWPRGRTEEGRGGVLVLVETGSRELGKASLKTTPCLRPEVGAPALDITVPGIDLGVVLELGGDKEPTPRLMEPPSTGRA